MRDGPQELERAGLTRIQVPGPRGASEEEARATGEGRGAFLRIRRKLLPLPPLGPCFRPRLLQDGQSTPLSSAGVSPTTGRGPKPCLLGWHRLFPVSRDHFAIQAPSAPFSTDGTILTPGRAGFMTTSLLTAIRGCDVFPASHRQGESRSVQCLLTDQRCRVSKPGRVPTRRKHLIPASPNPRTNRTPVLTQCTFNVYLLHTQGPFTDRF